MIFSLCSFASDTDHFYAWDKSLKDSTEHLNKYINNGMFKILDEVNKESLKDEGQCEYILDKIAKKFMILPSLFEKVARLIKSNLNIID